VKNAVIFGSDLIATNWAKANDVPRANVVLATHPDLVETIKGPIIVVRVPEREWTPYTMPDEKRVKETERLLKKRKRDGEKVQDDDYE
jgi:hypothetical protein